MASATDNAERRQRQITEEIAALGPCLPGSLVQRTTRCGSARCRCRTDPSQLHGPYPTWIRKAGAKTLTRTLSPAQLERYRPLFDNARRGDRIDDAGQIICGGYDRSGHVGAFLLPRTNRLPRGGLAGWPAAMAAPDR